MLRISRPELRSILSDYGIGHVIYTKPLQVESNIIIYPFRDAKYHYILITSDYLGNYDKFKMPHHFAFKFIDTNYRFHVVENYPRRDISSDAPGFNPYLHKASIGVDCMLYRLAL